MPEPTDKAVGALAAAMWSAYPRTAAWADVEDRQRQQITETARELLGAVYPQIAADVLDESAARLLDRRMPMDRVYADWLRAQADEVRP